MSVYSCSEICLNCDQLQDSLFYSRAYWVSEFLIAWDVDGDVSCYLYASRTAALTMSNNDGIQGQYMVALAYDMLSLIHLLIFVVMLYENRL